MLISEHSSKPFLASRARFARTKEGNVVHFSAKSKNEPHSPPLYERSEHRTISVKIVQN
jgi:hypothetical protein